MTPEEATRIVGYLLAAYRPRDWSDASSAVYVRALCAVEFEPSMAAAEAMVTTRRFMPTVAEVLEAAKSRSTGPPALRELPYRAGLTESEQEASRQIGAQVLAEFRTSHPEATARTFEDVVANPLPHEDVVRAVAQAEVERKREAARRLRDEAAS